MTKIMVVDDEKQILDIYSALLVKKGFEVIQASGGKEACDVLLSGVPLDLIILDMKMPQVTGLDVLNLRHKLRNSTPVIIVSGSMGQEEAYRGLEEFGFKVEDILYKPVDLYLLLDMINKKLLLRKPGQKL